MRLGTLGSPDTRRAPYSSITLTVRAPPSPLLARRYEKLNERIIAGLVDHKWIELAMEEGEWCGYCSCLPFCF